jgi:hypothetical protein
MTEQQPAMPERSQAEREFDHAMHHTFEAAGKETGYWAHRFLGLVRRRGGVGAARKLLADKEVSDGFLKLRKAGRLDLSIEYEVLRPKFDGLFTDTEREIARQRLVAYGVKPPS